MADERSSNSLPLDVVALIAAAEVDRANESVASRRDREAQAALRRESGLAAMEAYELDHGAFTEEELAEADRMLDAHFGPEPSA